ncbi:acyltransferase family protein, partial [Priestia megaterium]|uniref:acyltransferase family protein n=1 Tax=Priestia megaterium TaxID=1404 RepID=UPI000BDC14B1
MEIPKKRDERIDILRAIAILCIILAHSNPMGVIFQLRNFDVTMMVFLMGSSFFLSNQKKTINYGNYVIKRFKRLI